MSNQTRKISIVEFTHPGRQLYIHSTRPSSKFTFLNDEKTIGIRHWNQDSSGHYRKFLLSKGKFLTGIRSPVQETSLLFWGEWEPQSYFKILDNSDKLLPNAIHQPVFFDSAYTKKERKNFSSSCKPSERTILYHNTDPYVFSDHFYYSNCKQASRVFLKHLDTYSLILFGTEYNNYFVLDTVFVINQYFSSLNYNSYKQSLDPLLKESTLDLGKLYLENDNELILYQGLMQSDKKEIYSYVPCKLEKGNEKGFKRPILDIKKHKLQGFGAGSVSYRIEKNITREEVIRYWNSITLDVLKQGFYLGVQIDNPEIINSIGKGIWF